MLAVKMRKCALPDLTSFCGVMSVKTGTYFIALTNQAIAILGFVTYLSSVIIRVRGIQKDDDTTPREHAYHLLIGSTGIVITAAHIAMGAVLMRGLLKEKPGLLKWYLVIGSGVIGLTMLLTACTAVFLHWLTAIPTVFGMVMETYFMLVIRSAYREMVLEEKMLAAASNKY